MVKTKTPKLGEAVDTLKPYLERALRDEDFRKELKRALEAARELYVPLTKSNGGIAGSARKLATDKKAQRNLVSALEDLGRAAHTLQGKTGKKGHKTRNTVLLAGLVAGALYNPWTGATVRQWLLDRIAGDDDLQPLEDLVPPVPDAAADADVTLESST
jgi:hypothetical protein